MRFINGTLSSLFKLAAVQRQLPGRFKRQEIKEKSLLLPAFALHARSLARSFGNALIGRVV